MFPHNHPHTHSHGHSNSHVHKMMTKSLSSNNIAEPSSKMAAPLIKQQSNPPKLARFSSLAKSTIAANKMDTSAKKVTKRSLSLIKMNTTKFKDISAVKS